MKNPELRSRERLLHIDEALDKIHQYTSDLTFELFMEDSKCLDAVLFQLSVIGEAINHVDHDLLSRYPYPWHVVRAQRNFIAHEYFGIRMDKIWSVVRYDLPELKAVIKTILEEESH